MWQSANRRPGVSRAGSIMSAVVRAAVLASVAGLAAVRAAEVPQTWVFDLFVVAGCAYLLVSTFVVARNGDERRVTTILVAVDVLFITALVWQTNNYGTSYVLLYFLPVMHASIRLHLRQAMAAALLAMVCYSFVVVGAGLDTPIVSSALGHLSFFGCSLLVLTLFFGALAQALGAQEALSRDLERTVDRLKAVSQIARQAARLGGTDALLDTVADLAARRLEGVACYVALTDPTGALQVRTARGAASAGRQMPSFDRDLAERCLILLSPNWEPLKPAEQGAGATGTAATCICAPLAAGKVGMGAVQVFSTKPTFTPADSEWLSAVADEAAVAIENARLHQEVYRLSVTDELTGLYHRLEFDKIVEATLGRPDGDKASLGILLLDVDGLAGINQQFGHSAGDQVLLAVADLLRRSIRGSDVGARYGEDEFAVMLPGANLEGARVVAARLRELLVQQQFEFPPYPGRCSVTASIGAAVCRRGTGIRSHEALACAREAISLAKDAGHGQIRFWEAGITAPESVMPEVRALVNRFSDADAGGKE